MLGRTVSHYKVLEKLGEGGMGVVYKALDTRLERHVALKFLPAELTREAQAKERFIREAKAASSLDHTSICTVYEIGETEDGRTFIAMSFCDGETLKARIGRGALDIAGAVDIGLQIARGLQKAHEKGIVHRDIKPANVMITADGIVKIVDFGLAKLAGAVAVTRTGGILGTISYMSPEQVRGERVDHRADIWALGVTLYEMVTGRPPFRGEYEASIMYLILNESPEAVSSSRPDVPVELERIISKATAKDPDQRYPNVRGLIDDLAPLDRKLKSGAPMEPSPGGPRPGKPAVTTEPHASVAVLPFANLSADPEQEYFCDGMAENIINALAQLRDLHVVARTSAFSFKGKGADVREIGRKLGVESLLEGSVQKAGNRLRITVQLVNVADGYHVWSEKYDRNLEDIFAIQDEISQTIADRLKIRVLGADRAKLRKRHTDDPEAYNLYLRGRWFGEKYTEQGVKKAVEYYQLAIEKDPLFALAVAGLADSYIVLGGYAYLPRDVAYARARAEAIKAIELDDALPEAHLALASVKMWSDWDWTAAESEFRLALALSPSSAEVHHQYAHLLTHTGRSHEAVPHMSKALELEPVSVLIGSCAGQILYLARRYDDAIEQLKKTIEMDPNFHSPYSWLALAYTQKGMHEKAIEALKERVTSPTGGKGMMAALGYVYSVSGRTDEAMAILDELRGLSGKESVTPYYLARIYAGLGERERSLECLRECYEERDVFSLTFLKTDPVWDDLRRDSRFVDLLRNMGLGG